MLTVACAPYNVYSALALFSHMCWVIGILKNKYPNSVNIKKASGTSLNRKAAYI